MAYLLDKLSTVAVLFGQHLLLTGTVLAIGLFIAIPLGLLAARVDHLRGLILSVLGVIYTIPSLSLFVLLIPLFGLGAVPAVVALVAYAQLVLVRNLVVGLTGIEPWIIEAADGMGMNRGQRFWQVELPLAMPLMLAGIRLATIETIGIATIAAYIGAGGLGTLLFEGVITGNTQEIIAGSIAVSVLAIGANYLIYYFERRTSRALYGE